MGGCIKYRTSVRSLCKAVWLTAVDEWSRASGFSYFLRGGGGNTVTIRPRWSHGSSWRLLPKDRLVFVSTGNDAAGKENTLPKVLHLLDCTSDNALQLQHTGHRKTPLVIAINISIRFHSDAFESTPRDIRSIVHDPFPSKRTHRYDKSRSPIPVCSIIHHAGCARPGEFGACPPDCGCWKTVESRHKDSRHTSSQDPVQGPTERREWTVGFRKEDREGNWKGK